MKIQSLLIASLLMGTALPLGVPVVASAQQDDPSVTIVGFDQLPKTNTDTIVTESQVIRLNVDTGNLQPAANQDTFICLTSSVHLPIGGVIDTPDITDTLWGGAGNEGCDPHSVKITFPTNKVADFGTNVTVSPLSTYNFQAQKISVSFHGFDRAVRKLETPSFLLRKDIDHTTSNTWKVGGQVIAPGSVHRPGQADTIEAVLSIGFATKLPISDGTSHALEFNVPQSAKVVSTPPGWVCRIPVATSVLSCGVTDFSILTKQGEVLLTIDRSAIPDNAQTVLTIQGHEQGMRASTSGHDIFADNDTMNSTITIDTTPAPPQPVPPPASNTPKPPYSGLRPNWVPNRPPRPATPAPIAPLQSEPPAMAIPRAAAWATASVAKNQAVKTVLIGRDSIFADSLASGGLQGLLDAPLLLNDEHTLSAQTLAKLEALRPTQVVLLGGTNALSTEIEANLKDKGYTVKRVSGASRIETAIDAAKTFAPKATAALLARAYDAKGGSSSQAFADALGGGALAAQRGEPLLLTPSDRLAEPVKAYLATSSIKTIMVLGGEEAISPKVVDELNAMGIQVTRLSGATRNETAIRVAQAQGYWHAGEADAVVMVNGETEDAWTDAFPAALYAKRYAAPVILGSATTTSMTTSDWLLPGKVKPIPTRVICGYSVQPNPSCAFSPGEAK